MWREPGVKRIGRRLVWVCPVCEKVGRAWRKRGAVMAAQWHMRTHFTPKKCPMCVPCPAHEVRES